MGWIVNEIWEWVVIGAHGKFGWKGAAVAIGAPLIMIALIIWLIVILVNR